MFKLFFVNFLKLVNKVLISFQTFTFTLFKAAVIVMHKEQHLNLNIKTN